MIRCPFCSSARSSVVDAWDPRPDEHEHIRRRRKCKQCSKSYHTREYIEGNPVSPEALRIATSFMVRAQQYLSGQRVKGRGKAKMKFFMWKLYNGKWSPRFEKEKKSIKKEETSWYSNQYQVPEDTTLEEAIKLHPSP